MTTIAEIQGTGHTSPLAGETVTAEGGIVTAVEDNGFYIQDPNSDSNPSTSEGLFIFTGSQPSVNIGDEVNVKGEVSEFQPGPEEARNLTQTQIAFPDNVEVLSSGNELPAPVVIGENGRIPPSDNIDEDDFSEFNPSEAGIDFFESIEGMRATAEEAQAVGPTNRFGEIFTVVDNGNDATGISDRGTLNISEDDFNPEKVQIDFNRDFLPNFDFPEVNAGAELGNVTGVVSYDFGNFQIQPTQEFTITPSRLEPETSTIQAAGANLTVASYNVLNLDPNDGDGDSDVANGRFTSIANQIVNNLNTPDIIGLQEIQDNDGSEISDVSAADETLQLLVDRIEAAGGPSYEFIDTPGIVPAFENDQGEIVRPTGGQPGGNIRNAFLYNAERVNLVEGSVEPLTDPQDQAENSNNPFFGSRIPLSATFEFRGEEVTVINNHFSSKGGSSAILGQDQPFEELQNGAQKDLPDDVLNSLEPADRFVNGSFNERQRQAEAVKEFVDNLNADNIVALGDLNEFEFVEPVETLESSLTNLVETLPEEERYSFIFQGNSQELDHTLVSDNLAKTAKFDIVHTNAEFASTNERASDHEPLLTRLNLTAAKETPQPTIMKQSESPEPSNELQLSVAGTFSTGIFDEGAAEIVSYDAESQRLFVVNANAVSIDVLDVSDPTNPERINQIDATEFGASANSVAANNGLIAVAIEAEVVDERGQVVFLDSDGNFLNSVEAGFLPDFVTFSPDGEKVLVANEGEPNDAFTVDPEGSVSIIDISGGVETLTQDNVSEAGFTQFNDQREALEDDGVRIFGPDASVAQDLEPESVAVTPDNSTAYVALQENNALAVVDLETSEVTDIFALGFKDHSLPENALDASNEDGLNIQTIPSFGMLQPDAIDVFEVDGENFIITPNEGDGRDFDGFSEEANLDDLLEDGLLDLNDDDEPDTLETVTNATGETIEELLADDRLGTLDFTNATGDNDDDGLIEQLHNFGGRSFSIFDESGNLVFDSGDDFERITAELIPDNFNSNNDENDSFDSRSDNKGPEPEAVVTGEVNGDLFAFIGIERVGGIMVYNINNPSEPEFVEYINNRNFEVEAQLEDGSTNPEVGDLGTEGLEFISAEDSPNSEPLVAAGNEVSGTTTVYSVADMVEQPKAPQPTNELELSVAGTFSTGIFDEGAAEIVDYDSQTQRLFVVNSNATTVDILDVSDPNNPTRVSQIDASQFGDGANSVAVNNGLAAVAIEAGEIDANGQVVFFDTDGNQLGSAEVGILPDKVTFSPDGSKVITANEAEPNSDYTIDPEGSVSIIDISGGAENLSIDNVTNAGFTEFNDQKQQLIDQGVRIFGPSPGDDNETATVAQDLEPEFVTVTSDNRTAYVSLQENNALAKVDLNAGEVTEILPLGFKDHSQPQNQLDASDEDGINIQTVPTFGMYQPDAIDNFEMDGRTFIVTANEGDGREFEGDPGFVEEVKLEDLLDNDRLDLNDDDEADEGSTQVSSEETIEDLLAEDRLGELDLTNATGDTDDDGLIEQLHNFGGRSFSVWSESGELVFDSGDEFEQIIADQIDQGILPEAAFNNDNDVNEPDARSDAKGPEPEAITTGEIDGTPYAFIGLERVGGIMVYNLSNPSDPQFVQYVNNRNFVDEQGNLIPVQSEDGSPNPAAGDLGPEGVTFISAEDSPNGEPLVAVGNEISGSTTVYNVDVPQQQEPAFSLQLLHASDLEGGVNAIDNAPNFAAIVGQLEEEFENTLTISGGDNVIPGPFFNAALFTDDQVFNDAANNAFGLPSDVNGDGQPEQYESLEGDRGRIDMSIMNAIGFDASAVGNHEFDAGSDTFGGFLKSNFGDEVGLADDEWIGTQFPYLSANLDFSNNGALSDIATDQIISESEFVTGPQESLSGEVTPRLAPATILERGGEQIGVVGATTPLLQELSSPGNTEIVGPDENNVQALAEVLQPVIDQITEQGVNKVVLTTHLQQIALEQELIGELSGVDIVIAGGSGTILADETDTLRSGDQAADTYPIITENEDGDPAAIVSTAGEYSYVGRLVAEFDSNGVLIPESIDPEVSGAFATTDEIVNQVSGDNDPFAEGTKGSQVQTLVDSVEEVVNSQDGNVFGQTEVFLDGRREQVRTEETNLGNLTADANLEAAQNENDSVVVSIKNGGGIRGPIGEVGDQGELLPPQANPDTGKEQGEISQLDIVNSLRFNNGLTLLDVSRGELEKLIEHSVAGTAPGNTPGQFPQVSGLEFSFDPTRQAIEFNDNGTVATEGERVESLAITNDNGEPVDVIVENGELVGDPSEEIRLVTLNFLADGGDGYPFDDFGENRVDLVEPEAERTGEATFANDGSEQDALAEYLADNFPADDDPNTPAFSQEETPPSEDDRIVNLEKQQPEEPEPEPAGPIFGSTEADTLEATIDFEGGNNLVFTGNGDDQVFASQEAGNNRIYGGQGNDELEANTQDRLFGGAGNDILEASIGQGNNRLFGGDGNDDLIAGSQDRLFGGNGNDRLFLSEGQFEGGGNNTVTGGDGEDQFWLANAQLPGEANTITDFSAGEDVLGMAGLDLAFADLSIGASDENANNTVIATDSQNLAILLNVQADTITESDFVFETSAAN